VNAALPTLQKPNNLRIWWQAFRYHFVPPSIFPAVLGGLISWATTGLFFPLYFILVLVALILNHIALNMTDDYFDFKHNVDRLKPGEKNPYTGGSGTLSTGWLKPRNVFKAFSVFYLITVAIGLYLAWARGLPVLAFGLFGVFCAVFYTAPPVRLGYRGLGELVLLVNFGPVIGLGAFYVQAQAVTLEAFVATLPLGIMMFSLIVINEIPDIEGDRAAGKLTLVARYGKRAGMKLYVASWVASYAVIVGSAAFDITPVFSILALISLPFVYHSVTTLRAHHDDPIRLTPANLDMIKASNVCSFGLVAGYAVQGLLNGYDGFQLLFILVSLAVAYAPAASVLFRGKKSG
jgi:1,4-dihydroxy-2-naphthoate octaprenyltransferase